MMEQILIFDGCVELLNGTRSWYRDGLLHREDGPARIMNDGTEIWFYKDKKHREGGPAMTYYDGAMVWYYHGVIHRNDGPAIIGRPGDDNECWYRYGQLHRNDGPAITKNGFHLWFFDGVECASNRQYQELSGLDDMDMTTMILKYGNITARP